MEKIVQDPISKWLTEDIRVTVNVPHLLGTRDYLSDGHEDLTIVPKLIADRLGELGVIFLSEVLRVWRIDICHDIIPLTHPDLAVAQLFLLSEKTRRQDIHYWSSRSGLTLKIGSSKKYVRVYNKRGEAKRYLTPDEYGSMPDILRCEVRLDSKRNIVRHFGTNRLSSILVSGTVGLHGLFNQFILPLWNSPFTSSPVLSVMNVYEQKDFLLGLEIWNNGGLSVWEAAYRSSQVGQHPGTIRNHIKEAVRCLQFYLAHSAGIQDLGELVEMLRFPEPDTAASQTPALVVDYSPEHSAPD